LLFGDLARQVIEGMSVRPGQQLLELGCGSGWATKRLGKKAPGAQAVGIDVSARMIAFADSETDWTSRARFECMPMETLDLPDDRFDHALAIGSLELSGDAALAEARRVLKPGGRLEAVVVATPDSTASTSLGGAGLSVRSLDAAGWTAALEAAGFSVTSVTEMRDARVDGGLPPFEPTPWGPDAGAQASLLGGVFLHLSAEA
ncbi:MAG: class I SAM-dependent methyltransferase, partial [Planctomycetota bacterium]